MKEVVKEKNKAKKPFVLALTLSIILALFAIAGIVISFIFIEDLELYQSLIVAGAMVVIVVCGIVTTVLYNRYKDAE